MKTQDLIAALSNQPVPVRPAQSLRALWWAGAGGALLALPMMLGTVGLNPSLGATAAGESMFWVKLLFVAATAWGGFVVALRVAQPGRGVGGATWMLAAPAGLIWVAALAALLTAAPEERGTLVLGKTALHCPWLIAVLSLPSLLLLLAAMRSLAPTQLRAAGASAGLLAGALGASVYQFHCPELATPFLGTWYVLGMLMPATLGALVGPRVLRW